MNEFQELVLSQIGPEALDAPVPPERLNVFIDMGASRALATLREPPGGSRRTKTEVVNRALKVLAEVEQAQRDGAIYAKPDGAEHLTRIKFL